MAKIYQVILTEFAEERLEEITNYLLENASYEVANKVVNGMLDTIEKLAKLPNANPKELAICSEQIIYRRILKWSYKIIYIVKEDEIQVIVVDVRHTSEDPKKIIDRFKT